MEGKRLAPSARRPVALDSSLTHCGSSWGAQPEWHLPTECAPPTVPGPHFPSLAQPLLSQPGLPFQLQQRGPRSGVGRNRWKKCPPELAVARGGEQQDDHSPNTRVHLSLGTPPPVCAALACPLQASQGPLLDRFRYTQELTSTD